MHQMVSTRNTHLHHHHIVLTIGAGNIMLTAEGGTKHDVVSGLGRGRASRRNRDAFSAE